MLFPCRNRFISVNMLKKTGFPEKASGDIGPTAINGNS